MKKILFPVLLAVFGSFGLALSVFSPPYQAAYAAEPRPLIGSATKDWASLADGVGASQTMTIPGAALGDYCVASMSVDIVGMTLTCYISAANTATVRMQNESTATADLASGTLRIAVIKTRSTGG